MQSEHFRLTRIGIFYDGNYFRHVSDYYNYHHKRKARISIEGLHKFIRKEVATRERTDPAYCQIVDAHYFRGRLSAGEAQNRDVLFRERSFEDVLINEGVTTHFLPMGPSGEKGIDVWFSLEAFELAIYKRFSVSVLVTGDGDFVPLARKLNTLGTRVMLLAWDFEYTDQNGIQKATRTSQALIDEVTYPVMMADIIDDRSRIRDATTMNLFLRKPVPRPSGTGEPSDTNMRGEGEVVSLKDGYGFIEPTGGGLNLFFFHSDVENGDFNEIEIGDKLLFKRSKNDKGPCAKHVRKA
ncbi:MAG: NYN domain-containing protein [Bacteroidota bacterium]|nr:NYN domain-containing protein [Bacteroidota bacterium]